jgi:CRISPR system Cascade subunit CasC
LVGLEIEQLAHASPEEQEAIQNLVEKLARSGKGPSEEDLKLLRREIRAADIALFGRMLAAAPEFNFDAASQVSHAFTVHRIAVEDDYFTAVDDLNKGRDETGAGHVGVSEFGSGLFYLYVCVNRDLLLRNLSGDQALARSTLGALVEASAKVAPTGRQNSFASRAYASYILAERGPQQPRSLMAAFLKAVDGGREKDLLGESVQRLRETRARLDSVYGECARERREMSVPEGKGRFEDIKEFVAV